MGSKRDAIVSTRAESRSWTEGDEDGLKGYKVRTQKKGGTPVRSVQQKRVRKAACVGLGTSEPR
eukprot:6090804-Pleurochrysis_carterae.AAC.1